MSHSTPNKPTVGEVEERASTRLAAVGDVLKERHHQIARGHTPEADASHTLGELSQAAVATVCAADDLGEHGDMLARYFWPFDHRERPVAATGRRRLLVKAMALLLAELERLPQPGAQSAPTALLTDRQ